ncbi:hydantoinase B/oxoprolinase family protein [Acuticoccus sp. MNP-M23]|uniref:hydantoinase B/oxoprolinase family protein n=1 Tax=Acuticoccus sp. MNP-M23 TaxID=3072793 RepID=UPI002815649D|nr:hydantoinase B/oxoprolinase family protein [Acuticoccus sp. MNP-M23]WMS42227.1 hydantoinase B/oxoprolinase family protein [Acuticoccus sp. MNP-M23]
MTEDALSPVSLEIFRNALTATAAEMDITVWRTSRSTVVRELLDYSTAVFDRDGYNVAQAARIPQHLNSMGAGLLTVVSKHLPLSEWAEGDVVITNDPYCGGQHIPDILAFRPVFVDGERVAIVGTLCHHLDMGGMATGSYSATATEIVQEGLRIPPLKLIRGGKRDEAIFAIMMNNVRRPDMLHGDLQAQLASLNVGEANIRKLATRVGTETFVASCAKILDQSETAMRAMIARIPDGTYAFEDFMDDDGITEDPIRIHAEVTIAGEAATIDLSGCSRQAKGPVNATLASSLSGVTFAMLAVSDVDIPANAGVMRPITVVAPEGKVVSAKYPAPVANRIACTHRVATTILGALHQAIPDRVPAAYYGVSYVATFQTINEDGTRGVLVEIEVGGSGAHHDTDGLSGYTYGMHNNSNIPAEMIESDMPLTITAYGLLPGSGGAGRQRGGLGLFREWRVDSPEAVFSANGERFRFRPYGLEGGEPGREGHLTLIRGEERRELGSKVNNLALKQGDIIRLETSGGGGYGAPAGRTTERTEQDKALGYV